MFLLFLNMFSLGCALLYEVHVPHWISGHWKVSYIIELFHVQFIDCAHHVLN